MDYKFALKLKEAGFPQEDRHWYFCTLTYPTTLWCINALKEKKLYKEYEYMTASPTLEELIEACPKKNDNRAFSLAYLQNKWFCGYEQYERFTPECTGSTPTEAVANLWLELNTK